MVAYNFKTRFVRPIALGLGVSVPQDKFPPVVGERPKRQTIRAGFINGGGLAQSEKGRKHAEPGDIAQLYWGQRTKSCMKIGEARCTAIKPIMLWVDPKSLTIMLDGKVLGPRQLRQFAMDDGFAGPADMADFFTREHGAGKINGVVIYWEPFF